MINPIESLISNGFSQVFGDNTILGIIFLAFFVIYTMLMGTRLDGKAVILIPVGILSIAFISWAVYPIVLCIAFLIWRALARADNG